MADVKNRSRQIAEDGAPEFGIAFEMEFVGFRGRCVMYEVCEKVLNQKKIVLDRARFCSFFLNNTLDGALSKLLAAEGRRMSAEKLAADIREQFEENMAKKSTAVVPAFASAVSEAAARNFSVGALSFLSEESAAQLAERILPGDRIKIRVSREGARGLFMRDCWLGLAKMMGLTPRRCLALVSSAASCRSALAAEMRCVVVPDEFTEWQDFAGADEIVEKPEDLDVARLLKLASVKTVSFR